MPPPADRCPECAAPIPGRLAGCQAAWDELLLAAYAQPAFSGWRDLAFDAYCMQHPDTYCLSAKSYAAHLTRLCCGLETAGEPRVYAAIRRWLDGRVRLEKPPLLSERGKLTVADLCAAAPAGRSQAARLWAEEVWRAYAPQQALARRWLETALKK